MCLKHLNMGCINQPKDKVKYLKSTYAVVHINQPKYQPKDKIKVPNKLTQSIMEDVRNNENIEEISIEDFKAKFKRY